MFRSLNNFLNKFERIEKNKDFFFKPVVNKIIYYGVWMLPWNIGYWTYFWWVENGWYFKVWIMSNRDIFFWKYFKWDSRNFFFNINKKIFDNKISLFIKYVKKDFLRFFLRILILLSFFRKKLIEISIWEYILNRIFVFCYLSIFYLYFFEHIQVINVLLLILLIFIELIFMYFIEYILNYMSLVKLEYVEIIFKASDPLMLALIMDPLTYKYYLPAKAFFENNGTVWSFILGNSISLNILKKYMIWVNENTQGYYYKNMDILVKKDIVKLFKLSSIPFDILPKTRYVIFNLYYVDYSVNNLGRNKYSILEKKNFYLSLFEKTYDINSSVLSIIFLLRMNYPANSILIQDCLYNRINKEPVEKIIQFILMDQKLILWRFRLAEIHISNPVLLNLFYVLNSFFDVQFYNIEDRFMYNLLLVSDIKNRLPVIKLDGSIKKYRENIKFLSNFLFNQEEGVFWNMDVNKYLYKVSKHLELNRESYNRAFLNVAKLGESIDWNRSTMIQSSLNTKETFIEELEVYFEFDKKIDYGTLFNLHSVFYKTLDLKIIKIKVNQEVTIEEQLEILFDDLENLDSSNLESSRLYPYIDW